MCALVTGVQTCALPICGTRASWPCPVRVAGDQWGQARNQSSEGRVAEQAGEIKATLIKRRERRQLAQGRSAEAAAYIEVREDFEQIGRAWCRERVCQYV